MSAVAVVRLRTGAAPQTGKVQIDRSGNGAIRNVSIMKAGPAKGHGFVVDPTMLRQTHAGLQKGVPSRFQHPQRLLQDGTTMPLDPLGTHVGRVKSTGLSAAGDEVRGDIEFGPHAKNVPGLGDVATYLMDLAESDPSAFGLSVAYVPAEYGQDVDGTPLGRIDHVQACDLTGDPASNPNGLLSSGPVTDGDDGTMPPTSAPAAKSARKKIPRSKAVRAIVNWVGQMHGQDKPSVRQALCGAFPKLSKLLAADADQDEAEIMAALESAGIEIDDAGAEGSDETKALSSAIAASAMHVAGMALRARDLGYNLTAVRPMQSIGQGSLLAFDFPEGGNIEHVLDIAAAGVVSEIQSGMRDPLGGEILMRAGSLGTAPSVELAASAAAEKGLDFDLEWERAIKRAYWFLDGRQAALREFAELSLRTVPEPGTALLS